ncbi:uncharacterized protein BKA78DRAFT_310704 [Phyllosticta capitalensis]|uniref:uncharacterized protein n=1 Tax=Phyllosticta capitalensis TaxID=121624 RepID=UPI0031319AAE
MNMSKRSSASCPPSLSTKALPTSFHPVKVLAKSPSRKRRRPLSFHTWATTRPRSRTRQLLSSGTGQCLIRAPTSAVSPKRPSPTTVPRLLAIPMLTSLWSIVLRCILSREIVHYDSVSASPGLSSRAFPSPMGRPSAPMPWPRIRRRVLPIPRFCCPNCRNLRSTRLMRRNYQPVWSNKS